METNLTAVTYNKGKNHADWYNTYSEERGCLKKTEVVHFTRFKSIADLWWRQTQGLESRLCTAKKYAAQQISHADIIFLQEANQRNSYDKVFISELKKTHEIHYLNGQCTGGFEDDTAIALKLNLFEVKSYSPEVVKEHEKKIYSYTTILTAQHKSTKKVIALASLHLPGFSFDAIHDPIEDLRVKEIDQKVFVPILKKLNQISCDLVIFGADMNSSPTIRDHLEKNRFTLATKAGFTRLSCNQTTNVTYTCKKDREREIDFIFYKANNPWLLRMVQPSVTRLTNLSSNGKVWDSAKNGSDHLAVKGVFKI